MKKAFIIGDTHGNRRYLEQVISIAKKQGCDGIIVCGDFGYWPTEDFQTLYMKQCGKACLCLRPETFNENIYEEGRSIIEGEYELPVWFLDGNHEYFGTKMSNGLQHFTEPANELAPNLFYVPRGHVHRFGKTNVLFMGGGASMDKDNRIEGLDWFPEEQITEEQIDRALSFEHRIHLILSHTAPFSINMGVKPFLREIANREFLDILLDKVCPEFWFFGHYHMDECILRKGVLFHCLPSDSCESLKTGIVFDFEKRHHESILF